MLDYTYVNKLRWLGVVTETTEAYGILLAYGDFSPSERAIGTVAMYTDRIHGCLVAQ
jgi:hypothetical protein